MNRWTRGEAEIEKLLAEKQLQQVQGGQANGEHLIVKAGRTLATATAVGEQDPDSAYVLAYDAARYAGTALLAQQGLRPTTSGGHYAVELALRAQFGAGFRAFGTMRRRRHELEYPSGPGETTTRDEALETIADAQGMLNAAPPHADTWALLATQSRPTASARRAPISAEEISVAPGPTSTATCAATLERAGQDKSRLDNLERRGGPLYSCGKAHWRR